MQAEDLSAFERALRSAARGGDSEEDFTRRRGKRGRTLSYAEFERCAMEQVRCALDAQRQQPQRARDCVAELERRLRGLDVDGERCCSRADFLQLCSSHTSRGCAAEDANALASVCAAYAQSGRTQTLQSRDKGPLSRSDDSQSPQQRSTSQTVKVEERVELDEVLRLVRAAELGGAEAAVREAASAPYRRAYERTSESARLKLDARAGRAAAALLGGIYQAVPRLL